MAGSLTDRYVWVVTRRLPADRRAAAERELRAEIAELTGWMGERAALLELGHAARPAVMFPGGHRVLIGAVTYRDYVRQLRRWLAAVVLLLAALAAVGAVVVIALLLVQRRWSPVRGPDGEPVPVLDPDLWSGPAWVAIALIAAGAVLVVVAHRRGSWTWPLAAAVSAVDLLLLVLVARAAFTERLVNPAFLRGLSDDLGLDAVPRVHPLLITVPVTALLVWDAGEALRTAARTATTRPHPR